MAMAKFGRDVGIRESRDRRRRGAT